MNARSRIIALLAVGLLHPFATTIVPASQVSAQEQQKSEGLRLLEKTVQRTYAVHKLFRRVYSAGWEGANGAIGAAHLFAVTHDTALPLAYGRSMDLLKMYNGTWVELSTGRRILGWATMFIFVLTFIPAPFQMK